MTRGEIRSLAYYRLGIADGDDDDTFANIQINEDYRALVSELGTNIQTSPLVFVAADPIVDLPSDVLRVLTITRDGLSTQLDTYTPEGIADRQAARAVSGATSDDGPLGFSADGVTRIIVDPPPETTTASGAECRYVAAPAPLSLDADVPVALPVAYHNILVERLAAFLGLAEEEGAISQPAEVRDQQMGRKLSRDVARRTGGSRFNRRASLPPARTES